MIDIRKWSVIVLDSTAGRDKIIIFLCWILNHVSPLHHGMTWLWRVSRRKWCENVRWVGDWQMPIFECISSGGRVTGDRRRGARCAYLVTYDVVVRCHAASQRNHCHVSRDCTREFDQHQGILAAVGHLSFMKYLNSCNIKYMSWQSCRYLSI